MPSRSASSFIPSRDLPDLKGRVVIVTGGNSGIGYATVQHLARAGAKVYLAARSESKAIAAITKLQDDGLDPEKGGNVVFLDLELSDPRNAKKAAEHFLSLEDRLDVLVNCAAIINDHGTINTTSDGISEVMSTNHLGPYVFTEALIPLMKSTSTKANADVRIINVSSDGHIIHRNQKLRFDSKDAWNNKFEKDLIPSLSRYCYSKLAFQMWSHELVKRLDSEGSSIEVIILHPGTLFSEGSIAALKTLPLSSVVISIAKRTFIQPSKAAYLTCFAAASPLVREQRETWHGSYLKPKMVLGKPSPLALNEDKQRELVGFTERLLKELNVN